MNSFARGWIPRRRNAAGLDQHGAGGEGIGARNHRPEIPARWPPRLALEFENIAVETDKAGNNSFHKGKSRDRIDGAVACAITGYCSCAGTLSQRLPS